MAEKWPGFATSANTTVSMSNHTHSLSPSHSFSLSLFLSLHLSFRAAFVFDPTSSRSARFLAIEISCVYQIHTHMVYCMQSFIIDFCEGSLFPIQTFMTMLLVAFVCLSFSISFALFRTQFHPSLFLTESTFCLYTHIDAHIHMYHAQHIRRT